MLDAWRRRWWRPDPAAVAAYAGLRPMAVVTGGSEGIGYALARRFAATGRAVMLIARRPEPLERAAAAIRADFKVEAVALPLDVTAPDAIAAIDRALAEHGAYADVLVNSAGIGLAGPFHAHAPEDVMRLVDLNVRALTALTRHYLTGMRARGRGGILNLASLGGFTPGPYQAAYYASKAYVISLTEAIAAETDRGGRAHLRAGAGTGAHPMARPCRRRGRLLPLSAPGFARSRRPRRLRRLPAGAARHRAGAVEPVSCPGAALPAAPHHHAHRPAVVETTPAAKRAMSPIGSIFRELASDRAPREAGVPDESSFRPSRRSPSADQMACAAGIPRGVVEMDCAYGSDLSLRRASQRLAHLRCQRVARTLVRKVKTDDDDPITSLELAKACPSGLAHDRLARRHQRALVSRFAASAAAAGGHDLH